MNAESLAGNPCRSSPVEYHRKRAVAMPGCESRGESGAVELRSVCAVVPESVSVKEGRGRAVEGKIASIWPVIRPYRILTFSSSLISSLSRLLRILAGLAYALSTCWAGMYAS